MIGSLAIYIVILLYAPHDTALAYANARETIRVICSYVLVPSMVLVLVSGLLSMAVHRPFQEQRWVWAKALTGLSIFEATLGLVQSKANDAAAEAAKIALAEPGRAPLQTAIAHEWNVMLAILAIAVINVWLGVWRPRFARRAERARPPA